MFLENSSGEAGGGMENEYSSPIINNCDFIANLSDNGGGMLNTSCDITISQSSFFDNFAYNEGGAIDNYFSRFQITGCLLNRNRSRNVGGGISTFSDTVLVPTNIVESLVTNCTI